MNSGGVDIIREITGTGIPLRGNDVDTDQIIPARFLKVVTFDGLGEFAFFDQRFDEGDQPLDHPFNEDRFQFSNILVVNANFGCGSSREHAPQALMRWGIDAIVGESFAEIFAGNCLALGIPTITADSADVEALQAQIDQYPDTDIAVDIAEGTIQYDETTVDANVDSAQKRALVDGFWDTTALMQSNSDAVTATRANLPYTND